MSISNAVNFNYEGGLAPDLSEPVAADYNNSTSLYQRYSKP